MKQTRDLKKRPSGKIQKIAQNGPVKEKPTEGNKNTAKRMIASSQNNPHNRSKKLNENSKNMSNNSYKLEQNQKNTQKKKSYSSKSRYKRYI